MKLHFCKEKLVELNGDAILFLADQNRFWITEFQSSAGAVVIMKSKIHAFLDGRYFEKAKLQFKDTSIKLHEFQGIASVSKFLEAEGIENLLIENDYMVVTNYLFLKQHIKNLIPFNSKELRIVKTPKELDSMTFAAKIATEAMEWLKYEIKPGMTEKDVAIMATTKMMQLGAEKNSFDPIVASGYNGAFPHHQPTDKVIVEGEYITVDMGCIYEGYCSDLTRTFPIGNPQSDEMSKIYQVVLEANKAGIKAVKAGIKGSKLDKITRDVIEAAGYGEFFNHSTGHGVGIDVHEFPNVAKNYTKPIPAGSVITIEPGIYVPGLGGVRIEDDIYVSEQGYIVLTSSSSK